MESRRLRACPICVFQNQKRVGCFKRHFLRRKKLLSFCLQMVFPRGFARVTFAVAETQFFLPFLRRDQLNPHAVRCQHSEDEAVALPEIEHRRTRPAAPADVAANFFDCGANFTATRSSCGDNPRQQFQHVALRWRHGKRGNLVACPHGDSAGCANVNCDLSFHLLKLFSPLPAPSACKKIKVDSVSTPPSTTALRRVLWPLKIAFALRRSARRRKHCTRQSSDSRNQPSPRHTAF